MEEVLRINDLKVNYGGIEAVRGISFHVNKGEIVTLIGANGAGKSSTLRTISGLVKPSGGSVVFGGEDITAKDPTSIVSKGLMMVPEGRRIFPNLTVLENLKMGAYLRNDDLEKDIEMVYGYFPRLKERSWQAGGTLSGGEQQMLTGDLRYHQEDPRRRHNSSSYRAECKYGTSCSRPCIRNREWKDIH